MTKRPVKEDRGDFKLLADQIMHPKHDNGEDKAVPKSAIYPDVLTVHAGKGTGHLVTDEGVKTVDCLEIRTSKGEVIHIELFERESGQITIRSTTGSLLVLPMASNSIQLVPQSD